MQELKSAQISLNECITYTLNALKGALGSLKEPEWASMSWNEPKWA